MSFATDLYTQMSTYAGLTALISTRTYPVNAPQKVTLPCTVYSIINNERQYSHQGFSSLEKTWVQISCYGETYTSAKAVAAQVTAALEAWPGSNSKAQAIFLEDEQDIYEDDTEIHHILMDFTVWYG